MGAFDLIAGLLSQIASTAPILEVVERIVPEIAALGFGLVWVADIDEPHRSIATLKAVRDGGDVTREMPARVVVDPRQPIGVGFRDRRLVNIPDAAALHVLERDDDVVPQGTVVLSRLSYERVRGHPFACGPLFGAGGEPVAAVCLSSYRGHQAIPDDVLATGMLPALLALLAISADRARHAGRADRLAADLAHTHAMTAADAGLKSVGMAALAMAHDLNNFSAVTQISVDIGLRSPGQAAELLPRIDRSNRAISGMVARLRRLAHGAADDGKPADLARIVDDVVVMMTSQLRERTIEIDAEIPPLPPVRCDATLILQVVMNLIVNAQDALGEVPAERRQIQIRAREDGHGVRLSVADTGPGIAPDVLARLFRAGFTTKRGGHMGVGLAASQTALAPFGARLEARNALTGGAVFELVLAAAAPNAPDVLSRPEAVVGAPIAHARILIVDDDPDLVDIILAYLEPLGHAISTATTSAQAVDLAARQPADQPFDLVLCDVGMPKQNGIEVLRVLRAAGYRGKFVLMTGWESGALSVAARDAACDMLLPKPFVGGDLIKMLDTLLVR